MGLGFQGPKGEKVSLFGKLLEINLKNILCILF